MGIKKTLAVCVMVLVSWLLVIGSVYGAIELYRVFVPSSESNDNGFVMQAPF